MDKTINALGLMSGTSMDGIDASVIKSNGEETIEIVGNLFVKYESEFSNSLRSFCEKIHSLDDLKKNKSQYDELERLITIKHSEISSKICSKFNFNPEIIGFHGQTILHKPKKKYSIQMGNARLLSQLLKKKIIYQFRKKDIDNGGEGAPLTPIYHHKLKKKLKLKNTAIFLNIGGITNFTFTNGDNFFAKDIGPGNCLMDMYIKKTKKMEFDDEGKIAASGKVDISLINNILDQEYYKLNNHSFDIKDFDINFVKGQSTENALANLNYFTAKLISENIKKEISSSSNIILCGGGRKNKTLISNLKKFLKNNFFKIDHFDIDGDFIESQAFAYLAVRSLYGKFISYPSTTKVKNAISGGELIEIT